METAIVDQHIITKTIVPIKKKERDSAIDTIHGLVILNVIVGHIFMLAYADTPWLVNEILILFSFRMGWLLFKAGSYFRPLPMREMLAKGVRRFVVPFAVFSLLSEPVMYLRYLKEEPTFVAAIIKGVREDIISLFAGGSIPSNVPLWFLTALFGAKIIFTYAYNTRRYTIVAIAIMVAPLVNLLDLKLPYYVAYISAALTFYTAGYLLKDFRPRSAWAVWGMMAGAVLLFILYPVRVDMRFNSLIQGFYLLWVPESLLMNSLFRKYHVNIPLLSHIGRNSMGYYCLHWPVLLLIWHIFFLHKPHGTLWIVASGLASFILLPSLVWLIKHSRWKHIL